MRESMLVKRYLNSSFKKVELRKMMIKPHKKNIRLTVNCFFTADDLLTPAPRNYFPGIQQ